MRYRKLSPTGDYTFGQSLQNFYINVPAAVGQAVQTRLTLWLGEWFLDNSVGTPYMQGILGKHGQTTADNTVQQIVLGTTGIDSTSGGVVSVVTDLASFESTVNPVTRAYSATLTIDTLYGTTQVQMQNFANY